MNRLNSALRQIKSLLQLDRFRRFGMPLGLLLVIAVLCVVNLIQAQTIASQKELIQSLFQDSLELSAKRMQEHKPPTADFKSPEIAPPDRPTDPAAPVQQ
jgi:hypothetical protein